MKKLISILLLAICSMAHGEQAGTTTIGGTPLFTNEARVRISSFTMPEDGTVDSLVWYFESGSCASCTYGIALYNDDTGSPGNLIDSSTAVVNIASTGWHQLISALGVSLTNGVTYWICPIQDGGVGVDNDLAVYDAGTGGYIQDAQWPPDDPAGSYTAESRSFSGYVVYTPTGGAPTKIKVRR